MRAPRFPRARAASGLPVALVIFLAPAPASAQTSASPYTNAVRYDAVGRVTGTISADPDGAGALPFLAARNSYDGAGRLIRVETGTLSAWQSEAVAPANWTGFLPSSKIETIYDSRNRKIRDTLSTAAGVAQSVTQYSYDALGRLTCTAVRLNPALFGSLPASACTLGTQGTPPNDFGPDRITRNVYDAAGQRIQLREGVGTDVEAAEATWVYSPNGKVTTVIDGNGNRATMRYDAYDRQDRWTFPSPTRAAAYNDATQASALASAGAVNAADFEEYGYDPNGNRVTLRKRDLRRIFFAYDSLNRGTSKTYPDGGAAAVFYAYDLRNLQLSARFASQTGEGVTSAYDGFGRLRTSMLAMDGVSRTLTHHYDANGNRTQLDHPEWLSFTYVYDGLNRLTGVYEHIGTAVPLALFTYDAQGRRTNRAERQGSAVAYGYDSVGRLASIADTYPSSYGNLTTALGYNPAGQIRSRAQNNDIYAWNGAYTVNRPYTTDGLNQYSAAGTAAFTYDANGNLTSDGSTNFTYDIENRLVAASGSRTAGLRYDPLGRLYEVSGGAMTTRFLYDGDALVNEYNTAGVLYHRYVHGADAADDPLVWYGGGTYVWLHSDHQGSITGYANSTGNLSAINAYDEYGIPRATNVGRFQYTGQAWLAELGMYYYKARIYSPTLGRFLQTDPVGYDDQFNLYTYVGNDPVNMTDPSGQVIWENGKVKFNPDIRRQGEIIVHDSGTRSFGRHGFIYTDRGGAVEAIRNEGVSREMNTDCHGYTFANGEVWINNNMVNRLLRGDNYQIVQNSQVRPGDIVVYRDGRDPQHSGRVVSVEGGQVMVSSKAGVNPQPQTRPVEPGPGGAWWNPRSSYTYYRQETPTNRPPGMIHPDARDPF